MLIHVCIFTCCGAAGLMKIQENMTMVRQLIPPKESSEKRPELLLMIWFFLYMFIGAQMSYLLSPFVGRDRVFVFLSGQEGDFFSALFSLIRDVMY